MIFIMLFHQSAIYIGIKLTRLYVHSTIGSYVRIGRIPSGTVLIGLKKWLTSLNKEYSMKSILTILISVLTIGAFAQGQSGKQPASNSSAKSAPSGNCYSEWYSIFRERGAKPIPNGTHDIVITIRHGNYAECFMGKVDVFGGKISGKPQVQKVDGSYEEWDTRLSAYYFDSEGKIKNNAVLEIANGMSQELSGSEGEIVRAFFYQFLAEKPKANKKAPAPTSLIKN
jgi:hypothetical protein